jgi:hypothetical protein
MDKADNFKPLYILAISLIFYLVGCTDTSVQNLPTSIDYHSQIQIVNLASNAGAVKIDIYNPYGKLESTSGTLNLSDAFPGDGQNFLDIPSGVKNFIVTYANATTQTIRLTIDSERKIKLFLINTDPTTTDLIKNDQRYTWQLKNTANGQGLYPSDTASISFFNGTLDATISDVVVQAVGIIDTTINFSTALKTGKGNSYIKFKAPANYTITFKSDTLDLASTTFTPQSQGKYSAVIYGSQGSSSLQAKVYTDD